MNFRERDLRLALALDAECLHARAERAGFYAKQVGGAVISSDLPLAGFEGGDYIVPFDHFEFFGRAHMLSVIVSVGERSRGRSQAFWQGAIEFKFDRRAR